MNTSWQLWSAFLLGLPIGAAVAVFWTTILGWIIKGLLSKRLCVASLECNVAANHNPKSDGFAGCQVAPLMLPARCSCSQESVLPTPFQRLELVFVSRVKASTVFSVNAFRCINCGKVWPQDELIHLNKEV